MVKVNLALLKNRDAHPLCRITYTALLFCIAFIILPLSAKGQGAYTPVQPAADNFSYIHILPANGEDVSGWNDTLFYTHSLNVYYKVNSIKLDGDNPGLRELIDRAAPLIRRQKLKFHHVEVRGGASPEGPYANNERLSKGRAQALIDSAGHYMNIPKSYLITNTIAEDYDYLARLVQETGDVDADTVCAIITRHAGDAAATKAALKKLKGGSTWARMLRTLYPRLRAARVMFFYTLPVDSAIQEKEQKVEISIPSFIPPMEPIYRKADVTPTLWEARQPMLSIKTNILYTLFYLPRYGMAPIWNGSAEFYPRKGHYTIYGEFDCPWWHDDDVHKYFQARNYILEGRRYNRGKAAYNGSYWGVYGHINRFDVEFPGRRGWQGESFGFGLSYGYVLPLGKESRWRLEFNVGAGFAAFYYDPYDPLENKTHVYYYSFPGISLHKIFRRPADRTYLGPTRIGITLSYDLLFWKNKGEKKGQYNAFKKYMKE